MSSLAASWQCNTFHVRGEGAAGRPECQRNGARERNCVYELCPVLVGLRSANPELDLDLIVRIGYRKIYRAATVGNTVIANRPGEWFNAQNGLVFKYWGN